MDPGLHSGENYGEFTSNADAALSLLGDVGHNEPNPRDMHGDPSEERKQIALDEPETPTI